MDKAAQLVKRLGQLKSCRAVHEPHWRECYKFGAPERQQSFSGETVDSTRRTERAALLDSTASWSIQQLVASLISGTTPANSLWFRAVPDGIDDLSEITEGEKWLDQACKFIWRNIHGSNFDNEAHDSVLDGVVAGWAVLYTDIDRKEGGGFTFQSWPIGECYIASTRQDQIVDTIYREYELSAAAIVAEYGENNVSAEVLRASQDEPDRKFTILWVIQPREGYKEPKDNRPQHPKQMPFESVHIETQSKKIVRNSGYNEFPCACPRYRKIPNSVYGNGQMSIALPDAKQLNKLQELVIQSGELAIGGMWAAKDGGVMNVRTLRLGPRKIIAVDSVEDIKRLDDGTNFQVAEYMVTYLQANIRKALMADQLQPADGPAMTATEVHVRVDLIRQQLGPLYGRWQAEFLIPLLERCFGLAYRAGVLGEPPEELQGSNLSFKFVSPLARSQQLEDVSAIERLMTALQTYAQTYPEMLDNIDPDAIAQVTASSLGVPAEVLRTKKQIESVRTAKAQAQQQQMDQAQEASFTDNLGKEVAKGVGQSMTEEQRPS
ncbi:portal protein [Acinetobacter proteolyticus]|nr:portal protein [Acinetobacter proteolyticus]WEI17388.1 portal protein [Acinetobacter proteolyticus]